MRDYLIGAMVALWAAILIVLSVAAVSAAPQGRYVDIKVVGHYPCMEDEVLIGRGDYNGSWQRWRCATRDDL